MDADTRHQLKQNEFAEFLGKILDLNDKRTIAWLVVILVIALGYAGYNFWNWRQNVNLSESYQKLNAIDASDPTMGDGPLNELRQLIAGTSQPGLVAMARLQLARGLEVRGLEPGNEAKLDEAAKEYTTLVNMNRAPNSLKAAAVYRLGTVKESQRDMDAARGFYKQLSEEARFVGSPFVALADSRLSLLDQLSDPVVFTPGARPLAVTEPPADNMTIAPVEPQPNPGMLPIAKKPKPQTPPAESTPADAENESPAEPSEPADSPDTDNGESPATPSEPQQP